MKTLENSTKGNDMFGIKMPWTKRREAEEKKQAEQRKKIMDDFNAARDSRIRERDAQRRSTQPTDGADFGTYFINPHPYWLGNPSPHQEPERAISFSGGGGTSDGGGSSSDWSSSCSSSSSDSSSSSSSSSDSGSCSSSD